ncbi:MAG: hypothetical protein QGG42_17110 [Phycisphaerae bacterium]|jgi:hypothetical protein|nr:hypothetical protein [Phycisphaerae bacterium]
MQWIRENLFLTCLGGALVVCLGVVYTIRSGQDAAFKKEDMAPRAKLASRIGRYSRGKALNKDRLQKSQERIDGIRKQRDKVVREAAAWSKRNYSVLQLKVTSGGVVETIAAFPYDPAVYQRKDLTSKFTNAYRKVLYSTLAKLDLTAWPVDAEIGELSAKLEKDILAKRKAAIKRVEYAQNRSGATPPKDSDDDEPKEKPKKPDDVSQEDWELSNLSDEDVHEKARQTATEELMLVKANAGTMFVSPKTLAMVTDPKLPGAPAGPDELSVVFPQEVWKSADAPPDKLWRAQLNLWITQDILASVDATNQQSLRTAGGARKPTVPNAAIKFLRGIAISEQYVIDAGEDNDNENPALTQRGTSNDYEIMEYRFVVTMNTSHLPALMHHLITRGEHTITGVTIERLAVGPDGARYYGTDPVANVTLAGEILFRADWTRKIMPIETLTESLEGVLRPEDQERVKKAGG